MINRDISWLSFNERVLQEAQNVDVPLIQRMRFLGIYSNNLDEFFRVRVATLIRFQNALETSNAELAEQTKSILEQIQSRVIQLHAIFYETYEQILSQLTTENIFIKNEKNLDKKQANFVRSYFLKEVESLITPLIISNIKKFPYLKDQSVYLFISFTKKSDKQHHALIELPTDYISRFIELPSENDQKNIIYLDDVIRYNMPYILSIFEPLEISSYIIKLTRDAELDLDDDFSASYYEKVTKSVSDRKKGKVVRFVYDREMPETQLDYIISNIKLSPSTNLIPGGRYHNFRDFMGFPNLGREDLCYAEIPAIEHHSLNKSRPLLKQISERDILLQMPYHSFDIIIDIIREASIDPKVESIKMSLYRVAPKSKIIKALKNAARNGKQVYVVIELRARFDEEANLEWSKQLQDENIHIDFGLKGLKIHSKLLLIQRFSKGVLKNYSLISTGNFHEKTAKIYCDTALITSDERITNEVERVFQIFEKPYLSYTFEHLLIAPINLRKRLLDLIDNEIKVTLGGGKGHIFIKINNLVDEGIINAILNAAQQGVEVKLLVRGVCSLVPIENITIRSIVGRFLEHSRVFWFGDETSGKLYLGSADLMTRNLDIRIEALTPIYDDKIRKELIAYLLLQWSDNQRARIIDSNLSNTMYTNGEAPLRAQTALYDMLR